MDYITASEKTPLGRIVKAALEYLEARSKRADLYPGLGVFDDGWENVVRRVRLEVESPKVQRYLIEKLKREIDLDRTDEDLIYSSFIESLSGTLNYKKLLLNPHPQYRMDLRGFPMKQVKAELRRFVSLLEDWKINDPEKFNNYVEMFKQIGAFEWVTRNNRFMVFRPINSNTLELITVRERPNKYGSVRTASKNQNPIYLKTPKILRDLIKTANINKKQLIQKLAARELDAGMIWIPHFKKKKTLIELMPLTSKGSGKKTPIQTILSSDKSKNQKIDDLKKAIVEEMHAMGSGMTLKYAVGFTPTIVGRPGSGYFFMGELTSPVHFFIGEFSLVYVSPIEGISDPKAEVKYAQAILAPNKSAFQNHYLDFLELFIANLNKRFGLKPSDRI